MNKEIEKKYNDMMKKLRKGSKEKKNQEIIKRIKKIERT